jgi:hypothetical protein
MGPIHVSSIEAKGQQENLSTNKTYAQEIMSTSDIEDFCPNCGQPIYSSAQNCAYCGVRVEGKQST